MRMTGVTFGASRANTNSTAWNILLDRDISDASLYKTLVANGVESTPSHSEQEMYSGAAHTKWIVPWSTPTFLKAGVSYRAMIHRINRETHYWTFASAPTTGYAGWQSPLQFKTNFGTNIYTLDGPVGPIYVPNRTMLAQRLREHPEDFVYNANDSFKYWFINRVNYWEEIPAAYAMANTKLGKLQLQAGVRYEHTGAHLNMLPTPYTDVEMSALGMSITPQNEAYLHEKYKGGRRTWHKRAYDDYFLSASARYNFTSNLLVRAGFAQSLHRPEIRMLYDITNLNETIMDEEQQVANMDLRPEYSNNYSVEIEYYFEPAGKLAASVFCNDIRDVLYRRYWNEGIDGEIVRSEWLNGDRLTVRGFELEYNQSFAFLPGLLRYTGLNAAYSRNFFDKDNVDKEALASGVVPESASGGIWFNNGKFSVRLKGVWTSESLRTATQKNIVVQNVLYSFYPEIRRYESQLRLELDISYSFKTKKNRLLPSLFVSGKNILNEPRRTYSNVHGQLYEEVHFGATWTAGVKGSF
jgi:TonB-dependent receptor